jgi:hypothetical protein
LVPLSDEDQGHIALKIPYERSSSTINGRQLVIIAASPSRPFSAPADNPRMNRFESNQYATSTGNADSATPSAD